MHEGIVLDFFFFYLAETLRTSVQIIVELETYQKPLKPTTVQR